MKEQKDALCMIKASACTHLARMLQRSLKLECQDKREAEAKQRQRQKQKPKQNPIPRPSCIVACTFAIKLETLQC